MGNSNDHKSRIFAGLLLIGLGIVAFANYIWPGLLFVIGASMIISNLYHGKKVYDYLGALIVLIIGGVIAMENQKIEHELLQYWPAVLIVIGVFLVGYRLMEGKK